MHHEQHRAEAEAEERELVPPVFLFHGEEKQDRKQKTGNRQRPPFPAFSDCERSPFHSAQLNCGEPDRRDREQNRERKKQNIRDPEQFPVCKRTGQSRCKQNCKRRKTRQNVRRQLSG